MLTGKPAVRIGLNPMPGGSHWPHGIISGWSWFSAKHATVLIRRESYDANWGYYTQDASKLVDGKKKCLGVLSWKFSGNFNRCIFHGRFGFLGSPYEVLLIRGIPNHQPKAPIRLFVQGFWVCRLVASTFFLLLYKFNRRQSGTFVIRYGTHI